MVEKYLFKNFKQRPEDEQVQIIDFFKTERTQDETLAFFDYKRSAIKELTDDHTLSRRDERFINLAGNVQITPKYSIHEELRRGLDEARRGPKARARPEPRPARAPTETEQRVLDIIGTFRKGAPIQTGDVRFAAACDGLDLSDMDPAALTRVLKRRCEPRIDREVHRTYWYRTW